MKFVVLALVVVSGMASADDSMKKIETHTTESTVTTVKKKACPMVNGKEDCTVAEVTTKAMELKKKIKLK